MSRTLHYINFMKNKVRVCNLSLLTDEISYIYDELASEDLFEYRTTSLQSVV